MKIGDIFNYVVWAGVASFFIWLFWGANGPPETQEEFNHEANRHMQCYVHSEIQIVRTAGQNLYIGPDEYRILSSDFKFYYDKYAVEAGWSNQRKSSAERAYRFELESKAEFDLRKSMCSRLFSSLYD